MLEVLLFAISEATVERWVDKWGIGGLFALSLVGLLWFYGRRMILSQIKLSDAASAHLERDADSKQVIAQCLQTIAAATTTRNDPFGDRRYARHIFSTVYTNRAISRLSEGLQAGFEKLCSDAGDDVRPHFEAVQEIIRDDQTNGKH